MLSFNISGSDLSGPSTHSCSNFLGGIFEVSRQWTVRYANRTSDAPTVFVSDNSALGCDTQAVESGEGHGDWAVWDQTVVDMAARFGVAACDGDGGLTVSATVRPMVYRGFCAPRVRHTHPAAHADRRSFGRSVGGEAENRKAAARLVARDMAALAVAGVDAFVFA